MVGDSGAAALAQALGQPSCCLEVLGLAENYSVGTEGCRALGAALAAPHATLLELNLAKGHLGVEGARQLALGLR